MEIEPEDKRSDFDKHKNDVMVVFWYDRHPGDPPRHVDVGSDVGAIYGEAKDFGRLISAFPNAHVVSIHGFHFEQKLPFNDFPQIDTLKYGPTVKTKNLPRIMAMKHITKLSLNGSQIGDAGAKYLAGKSSLLSLDIRNAGITDDGARHFLKNTSLIELLIFTGNKISPELGTQINQQITTNNRILERVVSIAPVIAATLRPEMKDDPFRFSMLDLTKEIGKLLGHETLARTRLSKLLEIRANLTDIPEIGAKRKYMT
jgi:hypothetical protein